LQAGGARHRVDPRGGESAGGRALRADERGSKSVAARRPPGQSTEAARVRRGPAPGRCLASGSGRCQRRGPPPPARGPTLTAAPPEFKRLARDADVVPVYRELTADTLTPVSALQRIARPGSPAFLFESVVGGEKIARYSFAGASPFATFTSLGGKTTFGPPRGGVREVLAGDP